MHRCKKINQFHAAAAVISVAQIGARSLLEEEHEQHETHDAAAAADMSQSTTRTCLMRWPCHTNHTNDTQQPQPQPPSLLLAPERRTRRSTRRYHRLMDGHGHGHGLDCILFYCIRFYPFGPSYTVQLQLFCFDFFDCSMALDLLSHTLLYREREGQGGREEGRERVTNKQTCCSFRSKHSGIFYFSTFEIVKLPSMHRTPLPVMHTYIHFFYTI